MAASPLSLLIFSIFSSSLLQSCCLFPVAHAKGQGFHVVRPESLKPGTVCSSPKGTKRPSLTLSHRHGPCSPIPHQEQPTADQILHQDQLRLDHIQARLSSRASNSSQLQDSLLSVPTRLGLSVGSANFVATLGLGTPRQDQIVIIDTGSDLCWVQCQPCSCYPQQLPIYDPSKSSTYRHISCSGSDCPYLVRYVDNSSSSGIYGREKLTLSTTDVLPDFIFGCGQSQPAKFGKTSGLFGLGRSKTSLALQASQKYGTVFSYCLPPLSSSTGYLAFGQPEGDGAAISYTPMITYTDAPYYGVRLVGVSVGGQQLAISPSVWSSTNTILDSGTPISRLPQSAYAALRDAFRKAMSQYPTAPGTGVFDTCYDFSGYQSITVPKIYLHLSGGVTLDVDIYGILVGGCLAFADNQAVGSGTSIIGNAQQYRQEVVYDLGKSRIGFRPDACS